MKPVRGGRPPRDKSRRGTKAVMAGVLAQEVARALMVVVLFRIKVRNVDDVMMRYRARVRRVRVGVNCRTTTIQPRWAIDE